MKTKYYALLLFLLPAFTAFAQRGNRSTGIALPIVQSKKAVQVDCTPVSASSCNYISNNTFTPLPDYYSNYPTSMANPFNVDWMGTSYIPSWNVGNGTPTISDNYVFTDPLPPAGATGYFFGAVGYEPTVGGNMSENVVQKIPKLTANKDYVFSMYKMHKDYSYLTGIDAPADHLNIVLLHCGDYQQLFVPFTYQVPALLTHAQMIYCETQVINATWDRVYFKFRANDDYDMIWIYPQLDLNHYDPSGIFVSSPELIPVSDFTAGPTPHPNTAQNCMVTIGPLTPNCGPTGAVFTWTSPTHVTYPAAANQQLQVDASISANLGTWRLTMTLPGTTTTNSSCGIQDPIVTATVTIPSCSSAGLWPKAYGTVDGLLSFFKDNKGDVMMSAAGLMNTGPFYNHAGVFPSPAVLYSSTFQYTSAGVTNWIKPDKLPVFAFKSGTVQLQDLGYNNAGFINGSTGNAVAAPLALAQQERIIAETNTGAVITLLNNQFKVYAGGNSSTVNTGSSGALFCKFNPVKNNLIVVEPYAQTFRLYHFTGTSLSLTASTSIPFSSDIYQADDNDRCYYLAQSAGNTVVKVYDYTTGASSVVSVNGFNNQEVAPFRSGGNYTNNRCLIYCNADHYLYLVDFFTQAVRKVLTVNYTAEGMSELDGNDVYIAGYFNYAFPLMSIGNQDIPLPPGNIPVPVYITKLDLLSDFGAKDGPTRKDAPGDAFSISLSVNPVPANEVRIGITDPGNASLHSIIVTDPSGKIVQQQQTSEQTISLDVSKLPAGVYHVTVTNAKKERAATSFVKL